MLKSALAVPAGMYLRGARNIATVTALSMILLIIIINAKYDDILLAGYLIFMSTFP